MRTPTNSEAGRLYLRLCERAFEDGHVVDDARHVGVGRGIAANAAEDVMRLDASEVPGVELTTALLAR